MKARILSPGMLTTVQDLGRFGYAHLGISPAGAADALSFRIANLLVGNSENEPALEMTLTGATLAFDDRAVVSLTGATVVRRNSEPLPMWCAMEVPAGVALECGHILHGARAYLAVQGGFNLPVQMRSASTHPASNIGGVQGRALRRGDVLEYGASPHGSARRFESGLLERMNDA